MIWALAASAIQTLFDEGASSSSWRVAKIALDAIIAAVRPVITLAMLQLAMLQRASAKPRKRLANPRRKRRQAVNYPHGRLS